METSDQPDNAFFSIGCVIQRGEIGQSGIYVFGYVVRIMRNLCRNTEDFLPLIGKGLHKGRFQNKFQIIEHRLLLSCGAYETGFTAEACNL